MGIISMLFNRDGQGIRADTRREDIAALRALREYDSTLAMAVVTLAFRGKTGIQIADEIAPFLTDTQADPVISAAICSAVRRYEEALEKIR